MKKAVSMFSQVILTIGILVAAAIAIVQLRGIFTAETRLAQEEVVVSFAKDLDSIIDKALGTTGDAKFIYNTPIRKYRVEVGDNHVTLLDKLANKSTIFTKSTQIIIKNVIEDSDQIIVLKKGDQVFILAPPLPDGKACVNSAACASGKCWGTNNSFICQSTCAPVGETASDDASCCTSFLNKTIGKCDLPPFCPSKSSGCSSDPSTIQIGGQACCPFDKPVCSGGKCCPADKPRYCSRPKPGFDAGCKSDEEFKNQCQIKVYRIAFSPIHYGPNEFEAFKKDAAAVFDKWYSLSPFATCSDGRNRVEPLYIDPRDCQQSCYGICPGTGNCQDVALKCATDSQFGSVFDIVVGLCKGNSCGDPLYPGTCGCAGGIPAITSVTNFGSNCNGLIGREVAAHEIGHSFGLCHIELCGAFGNIEGCPNYGEEKNPIFVMDYCSPVSKYGPLAFDHLKNRVFKDYLDGCE